MKYTPALIIGLLFAVWVHLVVKRRGGHSSGWVLFTVVLWPVAMLLAGFRYRSFSLKLVGTIGCALLTWALSLLAYIRFGNSANLWLSTLPSLVPYIVSSFAFLVVAVVNWTRYRKVSAVLLTSTIWSVVVMVSQFPVRVWISSFSDDKFVRFGLEQILILGFSVQLIAIVWAMFLDRQPRGAGDRNDAKYAEPEQQPP